MASSPKSTRTTQYVIWGSVLVVLALALVAVRSLTREHVNVLTARAAYADLAKTTPAVGKVEPIDDFQAHAQVAGQVEDIYVDVGDKVKAGQLLLKMQDADALARVASANSSLRAAELSLNDIEHGGTQDERTTYAGDLSRAKLQRQQDETTLAQLQQLQKQGAASPGEVADYQHRLAVDDSNIQSIAQHSTQRYGQADLAHAQAQLADAKAAVAAAQSNYANIDIRSKIAGTVYWLPVSQFDYISADPHDNDLIYVADLTRMQITAYFDEPEIGGLAAGQPVTVVWDAKPGRTWHGHITQPPTTIIGYGTRNVGECIIAVDDAHGDLPPGANVTVTVTTAQHHHVLSVPREALRDDGGQPYVFRIINDKLVRTPVQLNGGIVSLTRAEITGGLDEGDLVALHAINGRDLSDRLDVNPVPSTQ